MQPSRASLVMVERPTDRIRIALIWRSRSRHLGVCEIGGEPPVVLGDERWRALRPRQLLTARLILARAEIEHGLSVAILFFAPPTGFDEAIFDSRHGSKTPISSLADHLS